MEVKVQLTISDYKALQNFERSFEQLSFKLAKMYFDALIENIRTNKFGLWNDDNTLKRKKGNTPLIDSGELLNSIQLNGTTIMVKAGLHSSGLTFQELSDILEYGRRDKRIPAYPVWRLTWEEFKPTLVKVIKDKIGSDVEII